MSSAIQQLIDIGTPVTGAVSPGSRYYLIGTNTFDLPGGKEIVYLRRRFLPQPERFSALFVHTLVQGERLDIVAAQYLGDPEVFWRLCDANRAMRPEDLEVVGAQLLISLPEGVPGTSNA
jgi:hypothetical protein